MASAKRVKLADVRRGLASPDAEARGHTLHLLYICIDRQPELHAAAREIFRYAVEHETTGWVVITGLMGLEQLDGPDAVRQHWRRLLTQPDALAAGRAAMSAKHPSHLPMLLELLDKRPDFFFRRGVVYALGCMREPSVIPLLIRLGEDVAMQPSVVQALGDIGDTRAIPWLQTLVSSDLHLPELDERGAMWTLGDVAGQAIRRIEYWSGQSAPPRPSTRSSAAQTAVPPPTWGSSRAGIVPLHAWRPWSLLHPSLIPLIAAGLEVAWLFGLFALYLFMVGDQKPTFTVSDRFIYAIALPLPIIGTIAALTLLLGSLTPRLWHKVVAVLGGLICGFLAVVFGTNFLTH